ncbi:hypothetical protein RINTU1_15720 [Candidatus Regiella insecticola]|uniref:Uncharacterized protein n=1 Tax=Candidatus Regiella insecticola TaxID=138073 RepID=A0A6L2ZNZ2_9ENTR|nr:hypothetical protein RINTU1_15720 [Candidatus Regiella insecticola]
MKLPLGSHERSVRPMSVDKLRDSASTRSQQRGGFKGEGDRAYSKSSLSYAQWMENG